MVALLHGGVCGHGRCVSDCSVCLSRGLVFPLCLPDNRSKGASQPLCYSQPTGLRCETAGRSLSLLLVTVDAAALSLRSIDGYWLEVVDSVGADQYYAFRICHFPGAGSRWVPRRQNDRQRLLRAKSDGGG